MALYTPFLADATAKISNSRMQQEAGRLAQAAYMGDQEALGALYKLDPNTATQIRNQRLQEEQVQLQRQSTGLQMDATRQNMQQSAQEWALKNRERLQEILQNAAKLETFEQAQPYIAQQIEGLKAAGIQIPSGMTAESFTPEAFQQIKQLYAPKGEAYTLAEGAERYGPDGKLIAENPRERDPATNQRGDRIAGLTSRLQNVVPNPAEVAADIVDGNIEVEVLEDGSVRLIDKIKAASGRGMDAVVELPVGSLMGGDERVPPSPGSTLYSLADQAGGIAGAAKQVGAMLAGQFGVEAYPETLEAYQTIETAVSDMIRGMAINDKFPVGEMERLREEIKITPTIGNPGPVAKARMRSIDRSLRTRLSQFERDATDTTLSADIRNQQRTNGANIRNFLDLMGVPTKPAISELTVPAIQEMNAGDAREIIRQITEEEFNQMSPESINALMRKAGG